MDKSWVETQKKNAKEQFQKEKERIRQEIVSSTKMSKKAKDKILPLFDALVYGNDLYSDLSSINIELEFGWIHGDIENAKDYKAWLKDLKFDKFMRSTYCNYDRYLDSEPMQFDGDIIITDPCYITKEQDDADEPKWSDYYAYTSIYDYPDYNKQTRTSELFEADSKIYDEAHRKWSDAHPDDWEVCAYGKNMGALGIHNYMTRDTLYGDWSCTTFNADTEEKIGEFCADAGMVAVFDLKEVMNYNPAFDYHIERPWTTTLIRDFKGVVQFQVRHIEGVYEDTTEWWNEGDTWEEYVVEVVGKGINKSTGKPINFIGRQTGF